MLVAVALPKGQPFGVALTIMLVIALIGLVLAVLIPRQPIQSTGRQLQRGTGGPAVSTLMYAAAAGPG